MWEIKQYNNTNYQQKLYRILVQVTSPDSIEHNDRLLTDQLDMPITYDLEVMICIIHKDSWWGALEIDRV